jgi:hypothetical protein
MKSLATLVRLFTVHFTTFDRVEPTVKGTPENERA